MARSNRRKNSLQDTMLQDQADLGSPLPSRSADVVDAFMAILLSVLVDEGLLESLVEVIKDPKSVSSRNATVLMGEIIELANRLLPTSHVVQVRFSR